MPGTDAEQFSFPVGHRELRSVDEFRDLFLPGYYSPSELGPRARASLDLLLAHAPEGRFDFLDYGCGIGALTHQIARARPTWSVTGWEGDYSSFEIARQCFSLPNLEFERKPYDEFLRIKAADLDGIAFLEVIEHVDNPGAVLASFHRALRPGGLLLVSTPNFLGYNTLSTELWTTARVLLRRSSRAQVALQLNDREYDATTNSGHVVVYSLHTLANLLGSAGFLILDYGFARNPGRFPRSLFPETLITVARRPRE